MWEEIIAKIFQNGKKKKKSKSQIHEILHSVAQSCPTLCNPFGLGRRLLCPRDSPGKNTRLPFPASGDLPNPGIAPTPPSAPALWMASLPLSHWGSLPEIQ